MSNRRTRGFVLVEPLTQQRFVIAFLESPVKAIALLQATG
jgi:hypothetical protein